MSGQPLQVEILKTVWTQTQFGTVWTIASGFLACRRGHLQYFFIFSNRTLRFQKILIWLQFFSAEFCLAACMGGTWTGNSIWHLIADVLHLLVAGFWPAGLLPLALLLKKLRQISDPVALEIIATLVRRFSALSLVSVALLVATGFINSWFLVGSFSNLLGQTYGRWLLVKIILFCFAVAIGAVNLLRLKPRLAIGKFPGAKYRSNRRSIAIQHPGGIISRHRYCYHRGGSWNFTACQSLKISPRTNNHKRI